MNTTRALLAWTDAQLKHCPPSIYPAFTTTFDRHTLRMAYCITSPGVAQVVQDADGFGQSFPVCVLYSSVEGEPYSFQVIFSLS